VWTGNKYSSWLLSLKEFSNFHFRFKQCPFITRNFTWVFGYYSRNQKHFPTEAFFPNPYSVLERFCWLVSFGSQVVIVFLSTINVRIFVIKRNTWLQNWFSFSLYWHICLGNHVFRKKLTYSPQNSPTFPCKRKYLYMYVHLPVCGLLTLLMLRILYFIITFSKIKLSSRNFLFKMLSSFCSANNHNFPSRGPCCTFPPKIINFLRTRWVHKLDSSSWLALDLSP